MFRKALCLISYALLCSETAPTETATPSKDDSRIVGGQNATAHEFPAFVTAAFGCGATLLNNEWILTAAHCVYPGLNSPVVWAGRVYKANHVGREPCEQAANITKYIWHPNYNTSNHDNDIAVCKVSPPFVFNDWIHPAELVPKGFSDTVMATVIGHGRQDDTPEKQAGGEEQPALQKVEVPILSDERCKELLGDMFSKDSMLCAGYDEGEKNSCHGDSGGPLYWLKNGNQIQAGIVSWGVSCSGRKDPGVYVKVANYIDWIWDTIKNEANFNSSIPTSR